MDGRQAARRITESRPGGCYQPAQLKHDVKKKYGSDGAVPEHEYELLLVEAWARHDFLLEFGTRT